MPSRICRIALLLLLVLCNHSVAKPPSIVYFPKETIGPVPVMVWLHGYRAFPSLLEDAEYFQSVADKLKVAIIAIPGTTELHDGTYVWSEEPVADHHYIQDVLAKLAKESRLNLKQVGLFGFSQGAVVAGDIATRYPTAYRGALLMSPGSITDAKPAFDEAKGHKNQVYVIVCGAEENPGNVEMARLYHEVFQIIGAQSTKQEYADMSEHTRPPDFKERFPEWTTTILQLKAQSQ